MFVSRYPYSAKFPQSISFAANDQFLGLRKENDHWLYVFHEDGRLGAVPTNYVEKSKAKSVNEILTLIEAAVKAMQAIEIFEKDTIFDYLNIVKNQITANGVDTSLPEVPSRNKAKNVIKPVDSRDSVFSRKSSGLQPKKDSVSSSKRPAGVSFLMIDKLRNTTLTSYDRCVSGFVKMLQVLSENDSRFSALSEELISELMDPVPTVKRSVYTRTEDWKELQNHIDHLERRAKDQQESSWPLVDDETTVITDLDTFVELLCNADPDMVCTCLKDDRLPLTLSFLYQREKRTLVRRFYLLVVVATCHIQPSVWPVYLDSGLPMEIVREIRSSELSEVDIILDLRVLTVLLAKSNSLPVNLQNELDESFFDCVFAKLSKFDSGDADVAKDESTRALDPPESIANRAASARGDSANNAAAASPLLLDTFVQFFCAANRHFCATVSGNSGSSLTPIMSAMLSNQIASRDLIERLLYIFNRDADPLSLNGVTFVQRLRGNMHEGFDLSSQLYDGSALYRDPNDGPDVGLAARSRRFSAQGENGAGVVGAACEVNGNGEQHSSGKKSQYHLTDATLHTAPDTPRNSARKLLSDIFSSRDTANLVYRNDVNVIIDVIIRQICDLPASSMKLGEFLFCMDKVIRNTDCMSRHNGPYRLDDLLEALKGVEYSASGTTTGARDFTTSRSLRLTNELLTLLSAMNG